MKFPADLVESLRCHDGVSPGHGLFQFPGGDQPLGIDAILRRGRMDQQLWNRLGEDHPDETYWHPEFLMFADSNRAFPHEGGHAVIGHAASVSLALWCRRS
ncbi:hypothetical protein [[Kitasatospora] papulosa]|uniref:hypothetical protein n=1 Tax=[Kitasatospora] papulosa TaxID=1464011 RepID=UPI00386E482B